MSFPNPYPITGIQSPQPEIRYNINQFSTAPELATRFNLYLVGLGRLQAYGEGSEVPLGYYQIAGIHGVPYIHWMEKVDPEDRPGDYCTHGSALFLTWHRPYLLLLESDIKQQRIVEEALLVVKDYPEDVRQHYIDEASKIRIPYWDWATDATLPHAVLGTEVDIHLPTLTSSQPVKATIRNPLNLYQFQSYERRVRDFSLTGYPEFVAEDTTKRCPDLKYKSRPEVADEQLKAATVLDSDGVSLRDAIFHLLNNTNLSYGSFGNTGWHKARGETEFLSLESCHNTIHNLVGTDLRKKQDCRTPKDKKIPEGHMTEVPVSAFDPIFCHANVDRIPTKIWTSSMVQKSGNEKPTCFTYNYYYPELDPTLNEAQQSAHVLNEVYVLYGAVDAAAPPPDADKTFRPIHRAHIPAGLDLSADAIYRREWIVIIRVGKFLVQGNFNVFFFLGKEETDVDEWSTSKNLVGTFHTFKSQTDQCGNCAGQERNGAITCGGIHITAPLANKLEGGTTLHDADDVAKYIEQNLFWKVLRNDFVELDPATLVTNGEESLHIGVAEDQYEIG
ncbi:Di-copper centre-containing protein [Wilcoxina mikolae CBS 423.85]|nr:Di-copper centre-containing protein [Wilcoxina mikolae CBS 423.85]